MLEGDSIIDHSEYSERQLHRIDVHSSFSLKYKTQIKLYPVKVAFYTSYMVS